jgi:hypothetical protein
MSSRGGGDAASQVRSRCWAAAVVTASSSRAQAQAHRRSCRGEMAGDEFGMSVVDEIRGVSEMDSSRLHFS